MEVGNALAYQQGWWSVVRLSLARFMRGKARRCERALPRFLGALTPPQDSVNLKIRAQRRKELLWQVTNRR